MKKRTLKQGLAAFALIAGSLFMAAPAWADYTGNCAGAPTTLVSGNININDTTGSCVLPGDLSATGFITVSSSGILTAQNITSNGGDITLTSTGALKTLVLVSSGSTNINSNGSSGSTTITGTATADNGYIHVTAGDLIKITGATKTTAGGEIMLSAMSTITTKALSGATFVDVQSMGDSSDIKVTGAATATSGYVYFNSGGLLSVTGAVKSTANGHILLFAQKSLATGAITGASGKNVDIKAFMGGSPSVFTVHASGTPTNGTSGVIKATNGVLYLTNGTSGSSGDINVTASTDLVVSGTNTTRYLILNANNGKITLPGGTYAVNGTGANPAGQLHLLANNVVMTGDVILSAMQTATAAGSLHGVDIAAQSVSYGSSLKVIADGKGSGPGAAFVYMFTEGATTFSDNESPTSSFIFGTSSPSVVGPISYTGSGALTVSVNGDNSFLDVSAYPISFSGGPVTFQATGTVSHSINIADNNATLNSTTGLTFGGSGALIIDASGKGGDGGTVQIIADAAQVNATPVTIKANGPSSGNGNGGTVYAYSTGFNLNTGSIATISADAASAGTGNASTSAITFYPGGTANIALGTAAGQYAFSAKGGSTGGNGGTVALNAFSNPISINGGLSGNVSALGPTGNGGNIQINGSQFSTTGSGSMTADGGSTSGNGGQIHLSGGGTYSIGNSAGSVSLSAKAPGTANTTTNIAGTIEAGYASNLTVNGPGVLLNAGGNAGGGVLNVHDIGTLTVSGTVRADSAGTGKAGSITLAQTGFNTMTFVTNSTVSASGGCDGSGNCGVINVTSPLKILANAVAAFHADGTMGANGGQLNIIGNSDLIDLTGAEVTAVGDPSGTASKGGFINVSSNNQITIESALIHADGAGTGSGGQVRITTGTSQPLSVSAIATRITAKGGMNGDGGIVVIPSLSMLGSTPTNLFYVNTFIQAAAGSSVTATSHFGGSVSLNSVTCQKIFTGYAWPTAYWNCVNPSSPTATDGLPAQAAQTLIPGSVQPQLVNSSALLYVFQDNAHVTSFFHSTLPDPIAGLTFDEGTTLPKIAINVSVLENTVFPGTGNGPLSNNQLTEVTSHELGHSIDFSGGVGGETSGSGAYTTTITDDQNFLNSAGQPCQAGSAGPFNGLVDYQTNQQFCSNGGTGGVLNNPGGIYTGKTNSQIAAISQPGILSVNNEIYAQAFAYQDYVKTLSNQTGFFLTEVANGLFKKGYFDCAQVVGAQAGTCQEL